VQWLINEFKDLKREVQEKIDSALNSPVVKEQDARIAKLEGELKALKMRMGKNKE